jgi:hypothetical protein
MIIENLSGHDRKKLRLRMKHQLRRLHGNDDSLSGFTDIVKGIFRGVKGGVQAGKAANAIPAPAQRKTTVKKVIKKPKINPLLIAGIAGAGVLVFIISKKKRKGKR